jgi:hypothetical protein
MFFYSSLQHHLDHASITNTARYSAMSPEPFRDIGDSQRPSAPTNACSGGRSQKELIIRSAERVSQIPLHGGVSGCFLSLLRLGWKLQNSRLLTSDQVCQENDFAVWELQRIVVCVPFILVDLSEDRSLIANSFLPRPSTCSPNFSGE